MKKPEAYKAPLRSKAEIFKFLSGELMTPPHRRAWRGYDGSNWMLSWNVKCYNYDLTYENLLDTYRRMGDMSVETINNPHFLRVTREKWDDEDWGGADQQYKLWESAIEDCRESVDNDDTHKMLWDGGCFNVIYAFYGRSGGWLTMTHFDRLKLDSYTYDDWLKGIDYEGVLNRDMWHQIQQLYKLVVQNDHDFRPEAVRRELEYRAAWTFFGNMCSDLDLLPPEVHTRRFLEALQQRPTRRITRFQRQLTDVVVADRPVRRIQKLKGT